MREGERRCKTEKMTCTTVNKVFVLFVCTIVQRPSFSQKLKDFLAPSPCLVTLNHQTHMHCIKKIHFLPLYNFRVSYLDEYLTSCSLTMYKNFWKRQRRVQVIRARAQVGKNRQIHFAHSGSKMGLERPYPYESK